LAGCFPARWRIIAREEGKELEKKEKEVGREFATCGEGIYRDYYFFRVSGK
jgi:hypothetical protein